MPYRNGFRLLPDQAGALHSYLHHEGGFYPIPVGGGKTAVCMLVASHYHRKHPRDKILLLIPASVHSQFFMRDLPWARKHLVITVPWFGLGNTNRQKRLTLARSERPGCYVLPYSCLSTTDTIELLREINPSLVIADEAHLLRGKSAKTKRFWGFVSQRDKPPRGVCMSGTLTTKTPLDYHKLITWALGQNSPLPKSLVESAEWSKLLMSGAHPPTPQDLVDMRPLLNWAKQAGDTEGLRAAYKERLTTAPGFYASKGKAIKTSLEICNLNPGPPGETLQAMIFSTAERWVHPCGDVLSYGIELHATLRELSAGFYYDRVWPMDHPLVDQAIARHEAGQEYRKELRVFFNSTRLPREGLDTPMAVGKWHLDHGPIRHWDRLYELWAEWRGLDDPNLPERDSVPVRVSDYKIAHAARWARDSLTKDKGVILWVEHREVAVWLLERLKSMNLPCIGKGAGDSWHKDDGSDDRIVVASIRAHGTGKNLQHFQKQLVVQWPRSATQTEQLLGRTHRTGQQANRLTVHTCLRTNWDHEQMACTIMDTDYMESTMTDRLKLQIADWNPLPQQFPAELLRRRGWRVAANG